MAVHCVAAEHGELTEKESSWVELSQVPTNVVRSNNIHISFPPW